jgi:hypothetical protein
LVIFTFFTTAAAGRALPTRYGAAYTEYTETTGWIKQKRNCTAYLRKRVWRSGRVLKCGYPMQMQWCGEAWAGGAAGEAAGGADYNAGQGNTQQAAGGRSGMSKAADA